MKQTLHLRRILVKGQVLALIAVGEIPRHAIFYQDTWKNTFILVRLRTSKSRVSHNNSIVKLQCSSYIYRCIHVNVIGTTCSSFKDSLHIQSPGKVLFDRNFSTLLYKENPKNQPYWRWDTHLLDSFPFQIDELINYLELMRISWIFVYIFEIAFRNFERYLTFGILDMFF